MYGHIATATGWTLTQIEQLTLWDVNDLFDYWQDHPPTHLLVGAYVLGGSRKGKPGQGSQHNNLNELKQMVASAGGGIKRTMPETYHRG